eukprot:GDKJ01026789.1.p2 GENE.GDKJ01026789.1~~GDKJ01026789.1.p2  ORF type:complete len:158 (-),score=1.16 GDKJ01026789.1:603-1076(-)
MRLISGSHARLHTMIAKTQMTLSGAADGLSLGSITLDATLENQLNMNVLGTLCRNAGVHKITTSITNPRATSMLGIKTENSVHRRSMRIGGFPVSSLTNAQPPAAKSTDIINVNPAKSHVSRLTAVRWKASSVICRVRADCWSSNNCDTMVLAEHVF